MTNRTVRFLPFDVTVEAEEGTLLLDAARAAGVPLQAGCGAEGTCGECVVRILSGKKDERGSASLPEDLAEEGYALACRTRIRGDLTVILPEFAE